MIQIRETSELQTSCIQINQLTFTCLTSAIGTIEIAVKYVQN